MPLQVPVLAAWTRPIHWLMQRCEICYAHLLQNPAIVQIDLCQTLFVLAWLDPNWNLITSAQYGNAVAILALKNMLPFKIASFLILILSMELDLSSLASMMLIRICCRDSSWTILSTNKQTESASGGGYLSRLIGDACFFQNSIPFPCTSLCNFWIVFFKRRASSPTVIVQLMESSSASEYLKDTLLPPYHHHFQTQ